MKGIHTLYNSKKQLNVVTTAVKVETCILAKSNIFPNKLTSSTPTIILIEKGTALTKTLCKNLPLIILWLGSNPNITEGIPTWSSGWECG